MRLIVQLDKVTTIVESALRGYQEPQRLKLLDQKR
jgi:hypothetical protein